MSRLTWLAAVVGLLSIAQALASSTGSATPSVKISPTASSSHHATSSHSVNVTVTPSPNATSSHSIKPTLTTSKKGPHSITVTPTPTSTPKHPTIPCLFEIWFNNTKKDNNNNKTHNETCFRMQSCLTLNFTFNNSASSTKHHWLNVSKEFYNRTASICNENRSTIVFNWVNETNEYLLKLFFTASNKKGSQHWKFDNSTLIYTINNETPFKDYIKKDELKKGTLWANVSQSLFDETNSNVEFQRPYRCNSTVDVPFNGPFNYTASSNPHKLVSVDFNKTFNSSLRTQFLKVQVFKFRNVTSGDFGAERYCVFDSTGGSKIVPIAAGAALGFLVVVILIAYLISQVVARRKKTAYEALN